MEEESETEEETREEGGENISGLYQEDELGEGDRFHLSPCVRSND